MAVQETRVVVQRLLAKAAATAVALEDLAEEASRLVHRTYADMTGCPADPSGTALFAFRVQQDPVLAASAVPKVGELLALLELSTAQPTSPLCLVAASLAVPSAGSQHCANESTRHCF